MYIYGVDFTEESLENIFPPVGKKNVLEEENGFETKNQSIFNVKLSDDINKPK